MLAGVLNETGRILAREGNKKTLGAWLVDKLVETKGDVGELVVAVRRFFAALVPPALPPGIPCSASLSLTSVLSSPLAFCPSFLSFLSRFSPSFLPSFPSPAHQLASTFPAFNDSHPSPTPGGEPVYLFKKALWLLTVVSQRFSSRSGNEDGEEEETKPKFPLPDLKKEALPIFADNVLPSTPSLPPLFLPFPLFSLL